MESVWITWGDTETHWIHTRTVTSSPRCWTHLTCHRPRSPRIWTAAEGCKVTWKRHKRTQSGGKQPQLDVGDSKQPPNQKLSENSHKMINKRHIITQQNAKITQRGTKQAQDAKWQKQDLKLPQKPSRRWRRNHLQDVLMLWVVYGSVLVQWEDPDVFFSLVEWIAK